MQWKCHHDTFSRITWYWYVWNNLLIGMSKHWRCFSKLRCFLCQFLPVIFRFSAILRVMETQRVTLIWEHCTSRSLKKRWVSASSKISSSICKPKFSIVPASCKKTRTMLRLFLEAVKLTDLLHNDRNPPSQTFARRCRWGASGI